MNDSPFSALSPLAIVGGAGRMGAFFGELFRAAGVSVHSIEKDTPAHELKSILKSARTVIISVPIAKTVAIIENTIPLLAPNALLVDLTSIKEGPVKAMSKHSGEVLGLHPMFAPIPGGLANQTIVVCSHRGGAQSKLLCSFFELHGAKLQQLTAERHDRLMAVVQGLNHFHSIVFAHAIKSIGLPVEETIEVASPVYRLHMQLMGRILAQDPQLYVDIQLFNPYVVEVLQAFQSSSEAFFNAIQSGSNTACLNFFTEAAASLGEYGKIALRESDELMAFAARAAQKPLSEK